MNVYLVLVTLTDARDLVIDSNSNVTLPPQSEREEGGH